ncbi:cupin domain-containing protein [Rhizobium mesoamericanum]|uniref:Anti-ECFsigma factor, ChrR n=1 Tax=Rhizobium mesoamericanum STM3625 TaxID=1211777 RepID=K0Q5C8_9HYPH|nr:cupin domain-containing protein [Rhizobium mesoamericanum]CCM79967.1 Anti-ECFsigma factor, ChrR [Rhizobium mesoamericanum STM3625]
MLLNEDLSRRTLVHAAALEWMPSPAKGVNRRMLFRIGEEKARATSIVRYAAGSRFAHHAHPGGEEFLVLDGVFQDDGGDFPMGAYVRNPPGSGHAPQSEDGCTILVKLWQFKADDRERVVIMPGEGEAGKLRAGVASSKILFEGASERVMLETWQPKAQVTIANFQGLELLVLDGAFSGAGEALGRWSWLRLPAEQHLHAKIRPEGARVWYKAAPLLHADVCAFDNPQSPSQSPGSNI